MSADADGDVPDWHAPSTRSNATNGVVVRKNLMESPPTVDRYGAGDGSTA
jgi:hypothetical protein